MGSAPVVDGYRHGVIDEGRGEPANDGRNESGDGRIDRNHRIVFRRGETRRLLAVSNALALCGLATVALATSAAVWLVVSTVDSGARAA